jgi:predicted RNA-binding Zn ribbon-like protein
MASVVIDGLVLPVRVAGHPALDFCNTRAGWGTPTPKEYLHSHRHLAVWARDTGLIPTTTPARNASTTVTPAVTSPDVIDAGPGAALLARALDLRTALYDVLVGPAAEASWAVVRAEVGYAHAAARLTPGAALARFTLPVDGPEAPLLAVAWAAGGLLTSVPAGAVAACPGAGCGWLFHDPRGRRRWCSMAWCGNRAKARRHADRARPRPAGD